MTVRRWSIRSSRSARSMMRASDALSSIRRMWKSGAMSGVARRGGRLGGEREVDEEGRARARLALDPDPAAVGLGDLLADRQAGPGPLVFVPGVEAAEQLEDPGVEPRVDPDPVVADGDR